MGIVRARKLARAALRNIQTEPVFRLFLQSPWNAHPGGATLPYHRASGVPDDPAATMRLSSVSVITNALQLRYFDL